MTTGSGPRWSVVFCSQNLPVPQDRRVWREAVALQRAGHRVVVVSPRGRRQRWRERCEGVEVRRFPAPPDLPGLFGHLVESAWALACVTVIVAWQRLQGRVDVLHAANPPDSFFLVAKLVRSRFVFDQHDLCPELLEARSGRPGGLLHRVLMALEQASYRTADLVITPNNSYRRIALSRGRCEAERVVTVRSGPDEVSQARGCREGALGVVFAGVMNEQDRLDVLLDAVAMVDRRRPGSVVLDLVGSGDAGPALRRQATRLGLDAKVRWPGWLEADELVERLARASVGVTIDGDDSFSRLSTMAKVPEYLGLGLPVVVADLPENRVTVGDAGLYFRPEDVDDLATCLERLVDDPDLLEQLGRAAARRGPLVRWEHGARRLVAAYRWLLEDHAPVPGDQIVEEPAHGVLPSASDGVQGRGI